MLPRLSPVPVTCVGRGPGGGGGGGGGGRSRCTALGPGLRVRLTEPESAPETESGGRAGCQRCARRRAGRRTVGPWPRHWQAQALAPGPRLPATVTALPMCKCMPVAVPGRATRCDCVRPVSGCWQPRRSFQAFNLKFQFAPAGGQSRRLGLRRAGRVPLGLRVRVTVPDPGVGAATARLGVWCWGHSRGG